MAKNYPVANDEPEIEDNGAEKKAETGKSLAKALSSKFRKPQIRIGVTSRSMAYPSDSSWRADEAKRLKKEISHLHGRLKAHDDVEAGKQVRAALEHHIKVKRLRLKEHLLRANAPDGIDTDFF